MGAIDNVYAARSKKRATGSTFIRRIFQDFIELHGDRCYADDPAVIGGIARFGDIPVTVIAIEKGTDTKERILRNFGMAHPEGYRKALRLMKQAEKFGRPIILLVDTSGAYCGIGAEERGQGQAIAENLCEMMELSVPIISIIIGEGGSGGALGLAVANEVWMLEKSWYSVISPEGCASILYKDAKFADRAAEDLKLTADDLLRLGVIEKVIPEEGELGVFRTLRTELRALLPGLIKKGGTVLKEERYQKFRSIGVFTEE